MNGMSVFSGNSNKALAQSISDYLSLHLGRAKIDRFSDGEIQVEIQENVRRQEVFVIQSTCAPVNDNIFELLLMIDALKRSSASYITAVIPYFGYSRQDKKVAPRVPISAKLIADLLTPDRGLTESLPWIFMRVKFRVFLIFPWIISTRHLLFWIISKPIFPVILSWSPPMPEVWNGPGPLPKTHAGLAIVDKRRSAPNQAKAMAIIGDVKGKTALILDDMVDTAGTLTEAAGIIEEKGAKAVHACCTHAVLSGPAVDRITNSSLESLMVTDTIPLSEAASNCEKITQVSISKLVSEAILRSYRGRFCKFSFCIENI